MRLLLSVLPVRLAGPALLVFVVPVHAHVFELFDGASHQLTGEEGTDRAVAFTAVDQAVLCELVALPIGLEDRHAGDLDAGSGVVDVTDHFADLKALGFTLLLVELVVEHVDHSTVVVLVPTTMTSPLLTFSLSSLMSVSVLPLRATRLELTSMRRADMLPGRLMPVATVVR